MILVKRRRQPERHAMTSILVKEKEVQSQCIAISESLVGKTFAFFSLQFFRPLLLVVLGS